MEVEEFAKSATPPLGHEPPADFESVTNERLGLLKLTPWRIVLVTYPAESYDAGHRV
jgi:hypothetical protein